MLKDLTDEILQAPEGTLFTYATDKDSGTDAWDAADIMCQKVDFLVRGYAARLPGTMWQRWILPTAESSGSDIIIDAKDTKQVTETLTSMESLLDRIWDEGHAYMTVRADRMQEKAERQLLKAPKEETQPLLESHGDEEETPQLTAEQKDEFAKAMAEYEKMEKEAEEEDFRLSEYGSSDVPSLDTEDDEDEEDDLPFMNDFALPGPTIGTFHTILDAMACNTSSPFVSIKQTRLFYDDIMARHRGMSLVV